MYKEYCFAYKVSSLPYWYTFKCYASNAKDAQKAFETETSVYAVQSYKLTSINSI